MDGKRLVSGSPDSKVLFWETEPIDKEPRRTAPYAVPDPAPIKRLASNELLALGQFQAAELTQGVVIKGKTEDQNVTPGAGQTFAVVVVSLPWRHFVLSEQGYTELRRRSEASEGALPLPSRLCLTQYTPDRFRLQRDGKQLGEAHLMGEWPTCISDHGRFTGAGVITTWSDAFDPDQRVGFALVWKLDAKTPTTDLSVVFDGGKPVPIPEVALRK